MSKIAVVYWSGTGNTLAMANAVEEGAKNAGLYKIFSKFVAAGEQKDVWGRIRL